MTCSGYVLYVLLVFTTYKEGCSDNLMPRTDLELAFKVRPDMVRA